MKDVSAPPSGEAGPRTSGTASTAGAPGHGASGGAAHEWDRPLVHAYRGVSP